MTVSRDTYISRMLALAGWDTLPAESAQRYPRVELDAALIARARHVLLSSEPYPFRARDAAALEKLVPPAARTRVKLIDGAMISWYGSRAIDGLAYLSHFRLAAGTGAQARA